MVMVQAVFEVAIQPVPERSGTGAACSAVSIDANTARACETAGGETGRSLLSPPPAPTQRRSLFRR